jgi:hypothetical protein
MTQPYEHEDCFLLSAFYLRSFSMDIIQNAVEDLKALLLSISAAMAVIGLLGLGLMYVSSSIPLLREWKESHPKAMRDVAIGLIILVLVSSGSVAAMLPGG